MDISSLLSPCADAPARRRQDHVASIISATASPIAHELVALDQQIVVLRNRKASSTSALAGVTGCKQRKQRKQMQHESVVRIRKHKLTARQLQVKSENQQDESQLYNLTLDINDLKQQVRDYMVHKSIVETRTLVARQRFNAGVLRTTRHYFDLLRTGFREWQPQEAAFFASTFDPQVAVKSLASSVEFLFNKWRMYKMLLQMWSFGISSIRILVSDAESCVVECEGEFEGTLTLAAIQALFPHILQDPQLLANVVNRDLVCPTRTLIYFDANCRIVEYNAHADMFAGLSRILASRPMDVISLMTSAHVEPVAGPSDRSGGGRAHRQFEVLDTVDDAESTCEPDYVLASPTCSTASSSSSLSSSTSTSSKSPRSSMAFILS